LQSEIHSEGYIYIASATFDSSVVNPEVLNNPPVITPRVSDTSEDRTELLKTLRNVSESIEWIEVPDQLTNLCLKRLSTAFQRSTKYHANIDKENCYLVGRQGKQDDPLAIVTKNEDGKLVCHSCFHLNLFGCPCPHTLAVARIFCPSEESLPFLEKTFRTLAGPFTTLTTLFPEDSQSSKDEIPTEEDVIGIDEFIQRSSTYRSTVAEEQQSEGLPSDISDSEAGAEENASKADHSRESTITVKEREAARTGKTSQQARKWLLERNLIPRLWETVYSREQFAQVYFNCINTLDNFEKTAHRMFPREEKPKETSTIRKIGYSENLRSSTMIHRRQVASKRAHLDSASCTASSAITSAKRKQQTAAKRNGAQKRPRLQNNEATHEGKWEVGNFQGLRIASKSILVKWKGFDEATWEPIANLKADLGSSFAHLWALLVQTLPTREANRAEKLFPNIKHA
jgi:hypothetical protein